jgi:cobalamin biosynthesis Mg chelatase CobN
MRLGRRIVARLFERRRTYGSNVNLLIDTGRWQNEDELADLFVQRKGFAYGVDGKPSAQPALMKRALGSATLSFQGLDSVDLGATDIDQYVESLGGRTRVIAQQRGSAPAVYVGDFNGAKGKVRSLAEQVELESRTKMLNPRWYESQLQYGYEGVRNIVIHDHHARLVGDGWGGHGAAVGVRGGLEDLRARRGDAGSAGAPQSRCGIGTGAATLGSDGPRILGAR